MAQTFGLRSGSRINGKYTVSQKLGAGIEGEVYEVRERRTGVRRAAKLFYPGHEEALRFSARKLEKLKDCRIITQYHSRDEIEVGGKPVEMLLGELAGGEPLAEHLKAMPGKRMSPTQGLLLLRSLVAGVVEIHARGEYHGDIHDDNILVRRRGIWYDLRLIDLHDHGRPSASNRFNDVLHCIDVLYDVLGGQKHYRKLPRPIKHIICGRKHGLIKKRYPTARKLLEHLDSFAWD